MKSLILHLELHAHDIPVLLMQAKFHMWPTSALRVHLPSLILSMQNNLQDRNDPPQLLVDTKQTFPVVFPYAPSALSLETLHIPASLGLDFLVRV